MRIEDTFEKLVTLYNKPFEELKLQEDISSFTINKGNTGTLFTSAVRYAKRQQVNRF